MTCHCNEPEGFSPYEQEDDESYDNDDSYAYDYYNYYEGI